VSRQDDIEPVRVGGPANYASTTAGPVVGYRVTAGTEPLGLVWYGADAADDAAGMIPRLDIDDAGNSAVYWAYRLRLAKAAGDPASGAVQGLRGAAGPAAHVGSVGMEAERFESLEAARAAVAADEVGGGPAPAAGTARRSATPPRPGRAAVDAALLGETPVTAAIRREIDDLDSALARSPTPEPVVVVRGASREEFPADLRDLTGQIRELPTYQLVRVAVEGAELPPEPVVLRLRVPAGVPSLHVPGTDEAGASRPRLLLARGLGLAVHRVVEHEGRVHLFGELLPRATPPLERAESS
jgi:hypothetical protein